MAKIPRFFADARVASGTVGVSVDAGLIGSFQKTGLEGRGMQELGREMEVVGRRISEEHLRAQAELKQKASKMADNNYVINSYSKFKLNSFKELNKRKQESGLNAEGFSNNFDQYFSEASEQLMQGAPSDEARLRLQSRLGNLRVQYMGDTLKHESAASRMSRLSVTGETINEYANQAFLNPEEGANLLKDAEEVADSLGGEGISPKQILNIKNNAKQNVMQSTLEGALRKDPVSVLSKLASGEFNELDNRTMVSVFNKATLKAKQQYDEAKKESEKQQLQTIYMSGIPLDKKNKEHRKAVDSQYNEFVGGFFDGEKLKTSPEVFAKSVTEFVAQRPSILPDLLRSQLETSVQHGGSKAKELYSKVITELDNNENTRPLLEDISKEALNEGLYISKLTASGIGASEAARQARENIRPERSDVRELRSADIKNFRSSKDGALSRENITSSIDDRFDSIFSSSPKNQELAVKEYTRFFEDAYMETGDVDIAKANASRQLSRTFGVTSLNGEKELMKNSPSMLYPGREAEVAGLYDGWLQSFDEREAVQKTVPSLGFRGGSETFSVPADVGNREIQIDGKMRKIIMQSDSFTPNDGGYSAFYYDENDEDNLFPHFLKNPITGATTRFIPKLGPSEDDQDVLEQIDVGRQEREEANRQIKENTAALASKVPELATQNDMTPVQKSSMMNSIKNFMKDLF